MENNQNIDRNKFTVPDGYFDKLENDILSKTVKAPVNRSAVFQMVKPWMSLAAGLLILAAAFFVFQDNSSTVTEENYHLADLDEALFDSMFEVEASDDETLEELADFLIDLEEF